MYICSTKFILRGRAEVARWAHNPKVVGSNPAPATKTIKSLQETEGFFNLATMYTVYALYSTKYDKIYIGYTSNIEQRLAQHNLLSGKGYTVKYRPWQIIYSETYETKKEAMAREKQLKSATGRNFIRQLIPSSS